MALIEKSGGIEGFVAIVQHEKSFINTPRSSLMLTYVVGLLIFVESTITSLVAGAIGKPLCDKHNISREKLAFVCDSTAAPVSALIILNGWGALLLGLIATQITLGQLSGNSMDILIDSILYNFYAMSALFVTFIAIWFTIDLGEMKHTKPALLESHRVALKQASMFLMLLPIILMVVLVFVFLYITGDGDILQGSGSSSIFYTMLFTWLFMLVYYVGSKNMNIKEWSTTSVTGAVKLIPIAAILLFAFALAQITVELKTGLYLASLAQGVIRVEFMALVIFLLSSLIAFSTGTSWGTFSIMIPVAVPMAVGMDANIALCIGAAISGGVLGDHASPISDTTIVAAMASECGLVEHVRTQLPYVLVSAVLSSILFLVFSIL
jgi:tetracycline resistance efflux pump